MLVYPKNDRFLLIDAICEHVRQGGCRQVGILWNKILQPPPSKFDTDTKDNFPTLVVIYIGVWNSILTQLALLLLPYSTLQLPVEACVGTAFGRTSFGFFRIRRVGAAVILHA